MLSKSIIVEGSIVTDGGLGSVVELDVGAQSMPSEEFRTVSFKGLVKVGRSYNKMFMFRVYISNRDSLIKRTSPVFWSQQY